VQKLSNQECRKKRKNSSGKAQKFTVGRDRRVRRFFRGAVAAATWFESPAVVQFTPPWRAFVTAGSCRNELCR
jgi:hypothetical protein